MVEDGEYPADMKNLGKMVENISYYNTLRYFRFDELIKDWSWSADDVLKQQDPPSSETGGRGIFLFASGCGLPMFSL